MEKTRKIVIDPIGVGLPYFVFEMFGFKPSHKIPRDDPRLVKIVEDAKNDVNHPLYEDVYDLKVVEIPADVVYYIDDNYGEGEVIHERHRVWC